MASTIKDWLDETRHNTNFMGRAVDRLGRKPANVGTQDERDTFQALMNASGATTSILLALEAIDKRIDSLEAKLETKNILSKLDLKSIQNEALKGASKKKYF
jgi:hypothetical protein